MRRGRWWAKGKKGGTYPCLQGSLFAPPQLLLPLLAFLFEVGLALDFGLVEAVDDGVFALGYVDALDLSAVLG